MICKFIIGLFVVIQYCLGDWVLEWNDEFEGNQLDLDKWNVTDGKKDPFETTLHDEIYNYAKNTTKNVMVKNGVLALSAFRENIRDRFFTTGTVTSLRPFLYGRLDIKAALPEGKLLMTSLVLIPRERNYGKELRNGLIEILVDVQRAEIYSTLYYDDEKYKQGIHTPRFQTNEFHNYSLEWNETQLTWRMNDHAYFTVDLTQNLSSIYEKPGQPFDQEFYLSMRIHAYTVRKTTFKSADDYHRDWKCPSLLIDHVRYYNKVNSTESDSWVHHETLENTNVSRVNTCESIKKEFYLVKDDQGNMSKSYIWMIIVPVCSLIIIVIILVIVLIWILRRKNKNNGKDDDSVDHNYYDGIDYDISYGTKQEFHGYLDIKDEKSRYHVINEDYDDVTFTEIYDQVHVIPDKTENADYLNMEISNL